jgi:DNA primase catalytic core
MIKQEDIDRVLAATNITEVVGECVKLSKKGASYTACCPFHNERTPSFVVTPAKGIYKCFGCGAAGNAIKFVQEFEQVSFPDAVRKLAARAHISWVETYKPTPEEQAKYARRESLKVATLWAQRYFFAFDRKAPIHVYLLERKFKGETVQRFGIGYAPAGWHDLETAATKEGFSKDVLLAASLIGEGERGTFGYFRNRVMFPICDVSGTVVGFTGRAIENGEKAKYLNSRDSELFSKGKCLFGIHLAKQEMVKQDECYLVEGNFDVLRMHECGVANTVAACGTALTREQVALIRRFTPNVTLCYDGDAAGIGAMFKNSELLLSEGMNVRIVSLPTGDDPDSYGMKVGAAMLKRQLEEKQDFVTFKYAQLRLASKNDPVALSAATAELVNTIAVIPDKNARQLYARTVAATFGIDVKPINEAVRKAAVKPVARQDSGWTGLEMAREAIRTENMCNITTSMETLVEYHASGKENTIAYFGTLDYANLQELNSLARRVVMLDNDARLVDHFGSNVTLAQLCFRLVELKFDVVIQAANEFGQTAPVNFLNAYPDACRRHIDEQDGDEALRVKLLEQCCELLSSLDETQMTIYLQTFAKALAIKDSDLKKILKPKLSAKKSKGALKLNMSNVAAHLQPLDINRLPDYVDKELLYRRRYFPYQDANGRKLFYVFLGEDNVSLRVVGNFYVEPVFHVHNIDRTQNKRVVSITNAASGVTRYAEWVSDNMVELSSFKKLVFNEGGNVFINGTSKDYDKILASISDYFPVCTELATFGQQDKDKACDFYAFANAIFSEGEMKYTDELGLVTHKDKTFYSPSFSKIYREIGVGYDMYENDRWFIYKESNHTDFATWTRMMSEVYKLNHNGWWATLFAMMSAFRSDIFTVNQHFTAPFFIGPTECGKTQIAVSIRSLYIHPDAHLFNLNTGTLAAFSTNLERYCDVPVIFDEYNDKQILDVMFQALKAATYDGVGRQKKKDATSKELSLSKVKCALVLLGQEQPTRDDNALANRCVLLQVPKKDDWTDEERDLLDELKRREKQGLSNVLVEILRQREVVRKHFAETFKKVLKELKTDLNSTGSAMQTRILNTVSLFLSMVRLWEMHVPTLRLPFTYRQFYEVAREKVVTQSESVTSTSRLNVFFETTELLLNQQYGGIKIGKEFKLEWRQSIKLQLSRTKTYEQHFDKETHVLYLRLNHIYPLYFNVRKGEALSMSDLKTYLQSHPAYIGMADGIRFSWMEYEETADELNPTNVHKIQRKASQVSSAVAMDYELLKELIGVDFEKYKPDEGEAAPPEDATLPPPPTNPAVTEVEMKFGNDAEKYKPPF